MRATLVIDVAITALVIALNFRGMSFYHTRRKIQVKN